MSKVSESAATLKTTAALTEDEKNVIHDATGDYDDLFAAVERIIATREAAAEQRGREDNADHGMCYVSGSKALAAKMAAAWDEGAAAVDFDQFAEEFVQPDNPYRP